MAEPVVENRPQKQCPHCLKAGQRSTIEIFIRTADGMVKSTAHYDQDGALHAPAPPKKPDIEFRCSQGHEWAEGEEPKPVEPKPAANASTLPKRA